MSISNRNYSWRPVSLDFLTSNYKINDAKLFAPLIVWLIVIAGSLFLTADLMNREWLTLTTDRVEIINFFILNPALILGMLLLFWFGFEWGFIPVYLCTFIVAYMSEITVLWASLIGMSFIFGMGFFALAYHSIRIPYTLRSFKSIAAFIVISFIAALASSMGSFIWSFFLQLSAQDTLIVWKSWWTGIFFQSILVLGPLLFILSPWVERKKRSTLSLPPQKEVSPKWIYGSVVSVALTLALFIFSGYLLGRLNVRETVGNNNMVLVSDIMGSLEAFQIITWTSIGLILVTGYAAIYLLHSWNNNLREQVETRTSDLVKSREELKVSLKEKDILFKEIQHRVKNNLAQVHGLLELQETMSEDEQVAELLKISKSRIRTMSLAHEALYNNENFSKISLKDYIENIAEVTHRSFRDSNKIINLSYEIEDIHLDMAKAIPLGLMISEILINAHKHAFNKAKDGEIKIFTSIQDDRMYMDISDNGSGLPKDVDLRRSNSLGMTLVNNFSDQLKAELKIGSNNKNGTRFEFSIPLHSIISD
ncbi:histidine kinase dimerization/phosphoacceptor domain -containing protein [Rhodohalobacter sp. 614A]|uniref:histidine kinase dimerization/phosphoacceptor domain -containing protein n=1 Tax=Rhodohalobacter sp. 614A TaxID=2908649 RepID=UPI001F2D1AF3|nr:histidine kinase dimerization/phosphoacceptor domain -containing protein [Rhodohalobacter sp. 614A]